MAGAILYLVWLNLFAHVKLPVGLLVLFILDWHGSHNRLEKRLNCKKNGTILPISPHMEIFSRQTHFFWKLRNLATYLIMIWTVTTLV